LFFFEVGDLHTEVTQHGAVTSKITNKKISSIFIIILRKYIFLIFEHVKQSVILFVKQILSLRVC